LDVYSNRQIDFFIDVPTWQWGAKGIGGGPLVLVLHTFNKQRVFQWCYKHVQIFILKCVVVDEGFSRLGIL